MKMGHLYTSVSPSKIFFGMYLKLYDYIDHSEG